MKWFTGAACNLNGAGAKKNRAPLFKAGRARNCPVRFAASRYGIT
jgi:hypothetical protein